MDSNNIMEMISNKQTIRTKIGDDILRKIFEYDPTYRNLFTNKVVDGIWGGAWQNWYMNSEECACPFVAVAMKWLFESWGVYKWGEPGYNPRDDPIPPLEFFKYNYFPSDIKIINREMRDIAHYVSIYVNGNRVLYCLVITIEYYENEYASIERDEDSEFYNMIDVFVDRRAGLVVLI